MIYVFDKNENKWIVRDAAPYEPMPGTIRGSLTVKEFMGHGYSSVLWSDLRALKALQKLQDLAAPIEMRVRAGFRRVADNTHSGQSAHCAGLAFDVGNSLTTKEQMLLSRIAVTQCGFDKVEPPYTTPGWLHVEKQIAPPASLKGVYPLLKEGDEGVHTLLLQDTLIMHGFLPLTLTGRFNSDTKSALTRFQKKNGLNVTGMADNESWNELMKVPEHVIRENERMKKSY